MFVAFVALVALVAWAVARLYVAVPSVRVALVPLAIVPGALAAYDVLRISSSYAAALVWQNYAYIIVLALAVSGTMAAVNRTRSEGRIAVAGGLLMLAGFVNVYLTGYLLGFYAWRGERPLPLR
jgi:hypothetical protein